MASRAALASNWRSLRPDPQAASIALLWWLMLAICGVIYAMAMLALLMTLPSRHAQSPAALAAWASDPTRERRPGQVVSGCVGVTALILILFVVASGLVDQAVTHDAEDPLLLIEITGQLVVGGPRPICRARRI